MLRQHYACFFRQLSRLGVIVPLRRPLFVLYTEPYFVRLISIRMLHAAIR